MNYQEILRTYKSIVCLNGELPKKEFFDRVALPVIAVDGASTSLHELGITPQIITGDLDSSNSTLFPDVERVCMPDQNYSDFEKTMRYLEDKDLLPAVITGISGGFIDHILYNIAIFSRTNSVFFTNSQVGMLVSDEIQLKLPIGTKISLLGCPDAVASSVGLKWELSDYNLALLGSNSCFNRTLRDQVVIKVSSGAALIIYYLGEVIDAGASIH